MANVSIAGSTSELMNSPSYCIGKRIFCKTYFSRVGRNILNHIQVRGRRTQLRVHVDYLKEYFEKSLFWHQQLISCGEYSKNGREKKWTRRLKKEYNRYLNIANSYLDVPKNRAAPPNSNKTTSLPTSNSGSSVAVVSIPSIPTSQSSTSASSGQPPVNGIDSTSQPSAKSKWPWLLASGERLDSWIDRAQIEAQPVKSELGAVAEIGSSVPFFVSRMESPKFYGDPKEWFKFAGSFYALVHIWSNDNDYRMTMLREALSPSVRDCLARYILDPSLYFEALSELKRTYGDPFLLANIYLQELDSLPLVPDDDPRALLAFVDSVHEIIYGLAKAKLHHELNSYWILIRLASKLPERLRYDWTAKMISLEKQNIRPHVGHFVECIDQMADVARIEITFRIN